MTSIQMPQLGETIVEGTILKWLKAEGDAVERDEPLFEISTDKVDTEVPSPVAGTLTKIVAPEGATVPVKTEVAVIEESGAAPGAAPDGGGDRSGATAASAPAERLVTASEEPTPVGAHARAGVMELPDSGPRSGIITPVVRRLASEHGIDLARVMGTGSGGRITRKDVQQAIAAGVGAAAPGAGPAAAPAAAAAPAQTPVMAPTTPAPAPVQVGTGDDAQPISHVRKAIGQHMLTSLQTSARAWTMVEVNVESLVQLRARVKDAFADRYGVKLTYLPFVTRTVVDALQAFPDVNARLDGDTVIRHRYVNMGIAVSYDAGLIVPVVKGADGMNTVGIARAIADLAARARAHQLLPDEVQDATFTITNPGPYGSLLSVPIINQPNTGILSLDAIQRRPIVVEDDAIAVRSMVYVSMSWDHRTIDGEIATKFLARVKHNLETWDFAEDLGL